MLGVNTVVAGAQAQVKRARAVELAAGGMSYDEVARAVGYSHRGSAHRAVFKALAEQEVQAVEDPRALELARLEALQAAIWDDATMGGDTRAARAILRISDQRVRLLGLHGCSGQKEDDSGGLKRSRRATEGNPGDATGV